MEGYMVSNPLSPILKYKLDICHALILCGIVTTITDECFSTIERFDILLYDHTSKCTDVNQARAKMFPRREPPMQFHLVMLLLSTYGGRYCISTKPFTRNLGVAQVWRRLIWTKLDKPTRSIQSMLWAYMLWLQEGLPWQMQKNCSKMYKSLFLWGGGGVFMRLNWQSTS